MNRSEHPVQLDVNWPGIEFKFQELCDPYHPNRARPFDPREKTTIPPGAIITLSNVSLLETP